MKLFKKIICLTMALIVVYAVSACNDELVNGETPSSSIIEESVFNIPATVQLAIAKMKEAGYSIDIGAEIVELNETYAEIGGKIEDAFCCIKRDNEKIDVLFVYWCDSKVAAENLYDVAKEDIMSELEEGHIYEVAEHIVYAGSQIAADDLFA